LTGCKTTPQKENSATTHQLCYSYIYGENGYLQDYSKAFEWCSKAAKNGGSSSITLLAELYLFGNGADKNLKKASDLYDEAAAKGHPHAQFMYFIVNFRDRANESTEQEKQKAIKYLKQAADQGLEKAIKLYRDLFTVKT
jgi:hypothetical protein